MLLYNIIYHNRAALIFWRLVQAEMYGAIQRYTPAISASTILCTKGIQRASAQMSKE